MLQLEVARRDWPYRVPFRIAYAERSHARSVIVTLSDKGHCGRGEAIGVSYRGESAETICAQLEGLRATIEAGITRDALAEQLPPGGARNALDCALWDLEAKRAGKRAWELAGMTRIEAVRTDCTIGIGAPDAMREQAAALHAFDRLKLKLGGRDGLDLARVEAVRAVRPDAELTIDANQGWTFDELVQAAPQLAELAVALLEQPLPASDDAALLAFESPVPLCADESCQTRASLPALAGKYDVINVKLDKTGGLTEALALAEAARRQGFGLMVGCMAGSSLAMAPALIVAQASDFVDLDGPVLLADDVPSGLAIDQGWIAPPDRELWG